MEVSLIKETGDIIKGSDTVSKSSHSQMLVSSELCVANNEHETNKCEHFTIRGYVADVRKREMNNCWPLFKLDNHTLEGHPDLVPPLSVKKFRHWNCQNCLHKAIAPENVVENGTDVHNYDEVQNNYRLLNANATTSSHRSPVKYVASLPQQCKEKSLKERTVEKDSFIHGSNGQCHSLLCLGQKDTKLQSSGSVKEGTKISRGRLKQMSKETVVAAEEKACQTGAGNIVVGANISGPTLLDKDTTSITVSMRKDTELIHGIGDVSGKMLTSMGFKPTVSDQKDGRRILKSKRSSRKRGREASDTNLDLVDTTVHRQNAVMKRASSVDVQQHNRGPKVHLIKEIIARDELHRIENVGVSSGDAETNNNHIRRDRAGSSKYTDHRSAGSNFEDKNPANRVHLVTQNDVRDFSRKKDVLTNDDGLLLAHLRKEVSTKRRKRKRNAESKHSNTKVGKCESVALKDLDLNVEYCGEKDEEAIIGEEKQSMMPDVIPSCSVLKNDELLTPTDNSHSKNAHSKLSEVRIFDKDLNHGIKAQENCGKIPLSNNQKNKRPRSEDGASSQTHWPKRQTGFKLYSKMERNRTSEQKTEDDITPLAKQQKEKNLMNCISDNGSMRNSLVMTENIKDGNMWGIGRACGSMVSEEMCWSISPIVPRSSVTEYNHPTTITNDGVVGNCLSAGRSKPNQYIDLNQEAPISFIDPNRSRSPQNNSWNGMNVLAGSRFSHNRSSSVLLNKIPVTNFRKLGFGLERVARDAAGYRRMGLCKGKQVSSSTKTFAVARNKHHPEKMDRGDSNADGYAISALNLLRLMHHQAACSGEHHMRSSQQSNGQGNELPISGVGVRSSEISKFPIRPVARYGILGPHLQKEIATSSNNSRLSLGLPSRYPDSISRGATSERIEYPVGAHVNNNKNGTFQPDRISTQKKMEECVVNRNPAEFAMPDDFDEYMVEYTEPRTQRKPQSKNLHSLPHQSGKKRRK